MEGLTLQVNNGDAHLAAYMEYRNLVGDTDGGVALSEKDYETLQKKAMKAKKNELYVYWRNVSTGMDCKCLGPSSKCFCCHRYRDHSWFDVDTKKVKCRMPGCRCQLFDYIPVHGREDLRCRCKHSVEHHDCVTAKCSRCPCGTFIAAFRCACGSSYEGHATFFETKSEREAAGLPVRPEGYGGTLAPMGGLSGMTSLLDGVDRQPHLLQTDVYKQLEKGAYTDSTDELAGRRPPSKVLRVPTTTVCSKPKESSHPKAAGRRDPMVGEAAVKKWR